MNITARQTIRLQAFENGGTCITWLYDQPKGPGLVGAIMSKIMGVMMRASLIKSVAEVGAAIEQLADEERRTQNAVSTPTPNIPLTTDR
ncbi:MAG: hypothetical protein HXY40_06625 [Chloroflexi bacterium]|nr:hypothetical protein [Chloroflexota bacterium]